MKMFHITVFFIIAIYKVFAESISSSSSSSSVSEPLVHNLSVSTFLDENGYIRLNVSWGEVKYDSEYISIYFNNDEECNPISDVENYPLDNRFIIRPGMELEHPADHLLHGCKYNITLRNKAVTNKTQSLIYKVPECVEKRCQCKDVVESPNKLTSIELVSDDLFVVSWNKSTNDNVTVHYIYYQRKDIENSIRTYIPEENLHYRNNSVEIPLHDIKQDVTYTITVVFIDEYNECIYMSSMDYTEPAQTHVPLFVMGGVSVLLFLLLLYTLSISFPKIRRKLEKYIGFFPKSYGEYHNEDLSTTPLSQFKLQEEVNAQYTPLEFVLKMHKYDEYEFPRNKVLTKEVIGEGAFGKVYYAKAYELGKNPGFTMVAVKQLREGASEEEVMDFHAEIEILKKIGRHENIVKLLGCVTMEKPYMMIMELVPCGSLKKYLLQLRKKWTERKNARTFFPDDMDEHWLKPNNQRSNLGQINYTSCLFDNSESSYIIPENHFPQTPLTSDSVFVKKSGELNSEAFGVERSRFPRLPNHVQPTQTLHTPSSMTSSRIPSSTETEFTNLDIELDTPPMKEMNHPPEPVLDHTELQQFAFQIANGMAHLEKVPITHRDLAARNILITSDKVLKISDYGMSRTGPYVNQKSKKVPLRWMAIESIENQKWDSKSDVWSFGVVLWEIGTLGAFPYDQTPDVLILPDLKKGKRLNRPRICTDSLYALMLQCWSEKSEGRPSFAELVELLDIQKQKVYVDFSQLSPKYVFPPTKQLNTLDENVK